jgi:hypothetical protein
MLEGKRVLGFGALELDFGDVRKGFVHRWSGR